MFVSEFHNEEEEPIYPHGPLRLPIDDNIKVSGIMCLIVNLQLLFAFVLFLSVVIKCSKSLLFVWTYGSTDVCKHVLPDCPLTRNTATDEPRLDFTEALSMPSFPLV